MSDTVLSKEGLSELSSILKKEINEVSSTDVSFSPSLTSGTKIGTLTIDGTSTDLYCETNTDTNTTYANATTSTAGLMSASDKTKLDGITASADSVSFSRSLTSGTKIGTLTINGTGTDLYSTNNTTYSAATTSAAGLMSASDKSKLDGLYYDPNGLDGNVLTWANNQTAGFATVGKIVNVGTTPTDTPYSSGETEALYWVMTIGDTDRRIVFSKTYAGGDYEFWARPVFQGSWNGEWVRLDVNKYFYTNGNFTCVDTEFATWNSIHIDDPTDSLYLHIFPYADGWGTFRIMYDLTNQYYADISIYKNGTAYVAAKSSSGYSVTKILTESDIQTSVGTAGIHKMSAGSSAATTSLCAAGAWYGQW